MKGKNKEFGRGKILMVLGVIIVISAVVMGCGKKTDTPAPVEAVKVINTLCPVMGGAVADGLTVEYKGQVIGVCCPGCIETFKKDPEKYMAKIKAE